MSETVGSEDAFIMLKSLSETMDSFTIAAFLGGNLRWRALQPEILQEAPKEVGLYVFRTKDGTRFGRLRGESDIIYIGSAKGQGGIRRRLYSHLHPGPTQATNKRSRWLQDKVQMEVAWECGETAASKEGLALGLYRQDHWEFPPLNRAGVESV